MCKCIFNYTKTFLKQISELQYQLYKGKLLISLIVVNIMFYNYILIQFHIKDIYRNMTL